LNPKFPPELLNSTGHAGTSSYLPGHDFDVCICGPDNMRCCDRMKLLHIMCSGVGVAQARPGEAAPWCPRCSRQPRPRHEETLEKSQSLLSCWNLAIQCADVTSKYQVSSSSLEPSHLHQAMTGLIT
jgi:hypothetical protein